MDFMGHWDWGDDSPHAAWRTDCCKPWDLGRDRSCPQRLEGMIAFGFVIICYGNWRVLISSPRLGPYADLILRLENRTTPVKQHPECQTTFFYSLQPWGIQRGQDVIDQFWNRQTWSLGDCYCKLLIYMEGWNEYILMNKNSQYATCRHFLKVILEINV